jgi:hypothetical protein
MKRMIVVAMTLVLMAAVAMPVDAQRRTSFGFAAGATIPTGVLGDATSTGFHALGTLACTTTSPERIQVPT